MNVVAELETVVEQLEGLEAMAAGDETLLAQRVAAVSGWSAAEHLDHLARADTVTLDGIDAILRDPAAGVPPSPTVVGRLVLWLRFIPRGRGRAPSVTRPGASDFEAVRSRLAGVRERFEGYRRRSGDLETSPAGLGHPYFGGLSPVQWVRFTAIHHRHHTKIAREVLAEARRRAPAPG